MVGGISIVGAVALRDGMEPSVYVVFILGRRTRLEHYRTASDRDGRGSG